MRIFAFDFEMDAPAINFFGKFEKGIKKPTAPQLLPFLALLLLPVAAGWLVVFLVIAATKWIRAGFKTK